ncbi:MAG: type II toxin-antitoxin system Phd/YefM family antitoxin [Deferrisomatales bacterium]
MTTIAVRKEQTELAEALRRLRTEGDRVVLEQDGEPVAAVVSVEDLRFLEQLEDRADLEAYRAAMEEWERDGRKTIPWEQVRDDLGL